MVGAVANGCLDFSRAVATCDRHGGIGAVLLETRPLTDATGRRAGRHAIGRGGRRRRGGSERSGRRENAEAKSAPSGPGTAPVRNRRAKYLMSDRSPAPIRAPSGAVLLEPRGARTPRLASRGAPERGKGERTGGGRRRRRAVRARRRSSSRPKTKTGWTAARRAWRRTEEIMESLRKFFWRCDHSFCVITIPF